MLKMDTSSKENHTERIPLLDSKLQDTSSCIKSRHVLAFMAFLGFVNVYALRVNLSVALVAMVNSSTNTNTTIGECLPPHGDNSTTHKDGEFDWGENLQGIILGSFFYGYIITQIPGGWLAERFGGKKLFGFGVLCTALLTLVTPLAARTSPNLLIATRILEGLGEGVTFPAMHAMWGKWAPPLERSKLISFTYAGAQLGTVISMPISGFLCSIDNGWPLVFYIFGSLGCLWFVLWMCVIHDTPGQHPRIDPQERKYIEESIGITSSRATPATPWVAILTSLPVWAIIVSHFSNNWGFYTLLTCLPKYMKEILKFDMSQSGVLSALPYLVLWILANVAGYAADELRSKRIMSTKTVRKVFNVLGLCLPALFIVLSGYVGCDHVLAVLFVSLSVGMGSFCFGGFMSNHIDLSPTFAGTLMGITNCAATIPGFVGPQIVGWLTDNNNTRGQWQIVFYISASVYAGGALFYALAGDGEEQPWSTGCALKTPRQIESPEKTINTNYSDEPNASADSLLCPAIENVD